MSDDPKLLEAIGRASFLSHLLEDRLKVHLFDCAFFEVGCMAHVLPERTKRATFEELIDFCRLAHANEKGTTEVWRQLHLVRQIRNRMVHGLLLEIHEDLHSDEGRDQITAMLNRYSVHVVRMLEVVGAAQEKVMRDAALQMGKVFKHPGHPLKEGTVASSEIERWLEEIEKNA